MSGNGKVNEDVIEGGSFYVDRLLWMILLSNGLPPFGYCHVCDLVPKSL